jgi:RNase P subunit RPR2
LFNVLRLAKWRILAQISMKHKVEFAQMFKKHFTRHCQTDVQATPPVSDIQQSTLITFFIYYLTVKIE